MVSCVIPSYCIYDLIDRERWCNWRRDRGLELPLGERSAQILDRTCHPFAGARLRRPERGSSALRVFGGHGEVDLSASFQRVEHPVHSCHHRPETVSLVVEVARPTDVSPTQELPAIELEVDDRTPHESCIEGHRRVVRDHRIGASDHLLDIDICIGGNADIFGQIKAALHR